MSIFIFKILQTLNISKIFLAKLENYTDIQFLNNHFILIEELEIILFIYHCVAEDDKYLCNNLHRSI